MRHVFTDGHFLQEIQTMISAGLCAPYYLPLTPVASRCIPEVLASVTSIEIPSDPGTLLVVSIAVNPD